MKSNLLCTLTLGLFLVCAVYTAWLSFRYFVSVHQFQQVRYDFMVFDQTRNAAQSLAGEAVEYSKKNPAIDPILQQYDLKPKASAAPPPSSQNSPKPPAQ